MLLLLLFGACVRPLQPQAGTQAASQRPLGIYVFVGERLTADSMKELPPNFIPFIKYSGYSRLEFCDWAFEYPAHSRQAYLGASKKRIEEAHDQGLQVFVLELTNMSRLWSNLSAEPAGKDLYKLLFNPVKEPLEFSQRVDDVRSSVTQGFSKADGFEVFAGDWGGCNGDGCSYKQYLSIGQAYAQAFRGLGLHPQLTLNTWAIANWGVTFDPGTTAFWDGESTLSSKIIDSNLSFADAVTLPGHNLYRGLTRQVYTKAHRPVPAWPDRTIVEKIHAKGKLVYLWPHFIVDDDRGRGATWRKVHFDVRYLRDLAQRSRSLGFDGSFMNVYNPGPDMGNIFAYGQLNRNPDLAVEAIFRQFAELLAEPNSVQELTEVFIFLENGSVWGAEMPRQYRLKPLPCRLRSHQEAAVALKSVKPLKSSPAPLLMTPAEYLAAISSTLSSLEHSH